MNNRRVFIAVNFPDFIKKKILEAERKYFKENIRWVGSHNLHITLVFAGYITDNELVELCKVVQEVTRRHESFEIKLEKICMGPTGKQPRMIWAVGKKSQELVELRSDLEDSLLGSETGLRKKEVRPFSPHVTLARLKEKIESREIPLNLSFSVENVEVMESELKKSGAEYSVIESVSLK